MTFEITPNLVRTLNAPLISIGITFFHGSETIEKAVASALAQTWKNIEIIIVDDGSDDAEASALKALHSKHPEIIVISHEINKGVAASRNEIINRAKGEFLAFFDDDDESLPTRLEEQHKRIIDYEKKYAQGHPVICYTARLQEYPDCHRRYEPTMGTNNGLAPNGVVVALRILTGKPQPNIFGSIATCSQMARLSTYRSLQGFDTDFRRSEDTDFNVRAAKKGAHFVGISTPLVKQTMTLSSDKKLFHEKEYAFKLLEKHRVFIEGHTNYKFCVGWLTAKYHFLQKDYKNFVLKMLSLQTRNPILSLQRLIWALPNTEFNFKFMRWHNAKERFDNNRNFML